MNVWRACAVLTVLVVALVPVTSGTSGGLLPSAPRVSVNIVNAFWGFAGQSPLGPAGSEEALRSACSRGFNFIRLAGTLFWPVEQAMYYTNTTQYWAAMDNLMDTATRHNCTLMPSLFWNWFAFPDLHKVALGTTMRNASSPSHVAMLKYTTEMVQRYDNRSCVAAWELGNELNLEADLNMTGRTGGIDVHMGTPTKRTRADNFSTADMITWETLLATTIRAAGSRKPISTGHAVPRPAAQHLRSSYHSPRRDWTEDTPDEFLQNLHDTSACCEIVSIHYYSGAGSRFGKVDPNTTHPLKLAQDYTAAHLKGKEVGVFEFGSPNPGPRHFLHDVLKAIKDYGIPHGLVWIWEFYQNSKTEMAPFSLKPGKTDQGAVTAMERLNNGTL